MGDPALQPDAQGGEAQYIEGLWTSGGFFEVLGVEAALGRTFTAADDRRGGGPDGPVAVISDEFWRRQFSGAVDAVGRPLMLGSVAFTVIGVTPPGFFGPDVGRRFDVVVPIGAEPLLNGVNSSLDQPGRFWLRIMVRRRAGQSVDAATAAVRAVQPQIRDGALRDFPQRPAAEFLTPFALTPASAGRSTLRDQYQRPLLLLMVVVGGVLLIACVNIANLMPARASARRHEMSVRVALGASRVQLVRLLLAEAALLSAVGALAGFGLSRWMGRLLVQQISTPGNAVFLDLAPDWRVMGFLTAVGLMTTALFGTVPAWQSARTDPIGALKEQGRGHTSARQLPVAAALVCVQVALSLVLVVAAGSFVRTFAALAFQDIGFRKEGVLVVNVTAPMTRYTLPQLVGVYDRVREAVAVVPGVERAALSDITPVSGAARTTGVEVPGGVPLTGRDSATFVNVISPGWIETYGMRLLAGRDIAPADRAGTAPVALVNEAFARRFLNGANPVGHTVVAGGPTAARIEIVGLVGDSVYRVLRDPAPPTMYTPTAQRPAARPFVSVIGMRMALGAGRADVVWLVMGRVAVMVIAGVAVGALVSLWASRFVGTLVWGLEPRDPATFVGAAVILTAVGALAAWLPAWRASRIDPAVVLRNE